MAIPSPLIVQRNGDFGQVGLPHNGKVEWLHSTATVLGLFEEWESPIEECQLSPGDTLALYTDGVRTPSHQS